MERSTRSLLIVSALVVAVFLAVNYVTKPTPPLAWWPAVGLVSLALLIWALGLRYGDPKSKTEAAEAAPKQVVPKPVAPPKPAPAPQKTAAPPPAPAPKVEVRKPEPVVVPSARQETPPVPEPKPAASPEPTVAPAAKKAPAKTASKSAAKPDDLTIIEGIGPKMSAALVAAGIDTYEKLSKTSEKELLAAVEAAGLRLAPTLPTWPEQAAFAVKGDDKGLKAFQDKLKGGRKSKK